MTRQIHERKFWKFLMTWSQIYWCQYYPGIYIALCYSAYLILLDTKFFHKVLSLVHRLWSSLYVYYFTASRLWVLLFEYSARSCFYLLTYFISLVYHTRWMYHICVIYTFITSAKEVLNSGPFVCPSVLPSVLPSVRLLAGLRKYYWSDFSKKNPQ